MKLQARTLAATIVAALVAILAPALPAHADVPPVNRVSCPSAAEINKLRPADSTEPPLAYGVQPAPYLCIYRFKTTANVPPTLEFGLNSYTLKPDTIEYYYEQERLGLLSNVQPLPELSSYAFSFADPQGFTVVTWQFSPGSLAYANLQFSWMIAAQVPIAKLFKPMMEVYTIPGERTVNGRQWRTTCEPYSSTWRCRTEIFATTIKKTPTGFESVKGWAFNSLTYRWSDRALWVNNPLGKTGQWTSTDGRQWRTECDTTKTGRGACRSYILTTVYDRQGGKYTQSNKWVFNNQVLFTY
ncbi:hypothetical protein [Tessaracoccus antarcticus]|uniref:DUF3558 domain-containing protein n=1 Tax=Tessaracoccus antarcticus TaxID=2479848 RepID=A0A3M0GNL3_9ACTN|nr:hypothetical protein [Tessaracoccus antarcticus]RMB58876.1 hypothetical protein EAX62_12220 [Tessaracoccus antarcticus]